MADRVIFIEQSGTALDGAKGPLDDARLEESVREAMKAPHQSRRGKTFHVKDFPDQVFVIARVVDVYARPRLLPREKYGAVALNAILGLVLSRSGRDAEVVERMRSLDVPWFQQLLARRAARLRTDLVARDSEAKIVDIADVLEQLSALDSPSLTP